MDGYYTDTDTDTEVGRERDNIFGIKETEFGFAMVFLFAESGGGKV